MARIIPYPVPGPRWQAGPVELPVAARVPHLGQVVPSVLASLGAGEFVNSLSLAEASSACVLLIDGLGWELLAEHAADAAGLGAIGTGLASGEHGLVGYTFDVPGTGVLNALRWCSHEDGGDLRGALPPREVQPLPTTFERAAAAGIATSVVSSAKFADTALTRATQFGGRYVGVHALGSLTPAEQLVPLVLARG